MEDDAKARLAEALETQQGDELLATIHAIDAEREADAEPIYPTEADLGMDIAEARAIVARFRVIRDAHRGRDVVDRLELPDASGRVAAAVIVAAQTDATELSGAPRKAAQRAAAEDLVDLQSFRTTDDVERIEGRGTDEERDAAREALTTARAAAITMIREDPTVTGSLNALLGLEIRIGDARIALDAVNRYRETQVLGFLAMLIGIPVLIGIGIVIVVVIFIANG